MKEDYFYILSGHDDFKDILKKNNIEVSDKHLKIVEKDSTEGRQIKEILGLM